MEIKKIKKIIRHRLGLIVLKILVGIVGFLPMKLIYFTGDIGGLLAYKLFGKYQKLVLDNLRIAFGSQAKKAKLEEIAKESFQNMSKTVFELISLARRPKDFRRQLIHIEGKKNLDSALSLGKGVIGITAHFGNFPLMGLCLATSGYEVNFLIRRERDPYLGDIFFRLREKAGVGTIFTEPVSQCIEQAIKALRENQILIILLDQDVGSSGVFVDFLGRPASTAGGPAVFAMRTGSPVLPIFTLRLKDGSHKIVIGQPIDVKNAGPQNEDIFSNTQTFSKVIESYIRRYPTQWTWMNKRWKTQLQEADSKVPEENNLEEKI